jgi:hypothetical protein
MKNRADGNRSYELTGCALHRGGLENRDTTGFRGENGSVPIFQTSVRSYALIERTADISNIKRVVEFESWRVEELNS